MREPYFQCVALTYHGICIIINSTWLAGNELWLKKNEKCCMNCDYSRYSPEYWHDHYLIQARLYCARPTMNEAAVKADGCCEYFVHTEEEDK